VAFLVNKDVLCDWKDLEKEKVGWHSQVLSATDKQQTTNPKCQRALEKVGY